MHRRFWSVSARELRGQLVVLVVVLWALAAVNTITPGPRYRSGQLKGADFLHFYVQGSLGAADRPEWLYDARAQHAWQVSLVPASTDTWFVPIYGPQTALVFMALARLPYLSAALCWSLLTGAGYAACVWLVWRRLPGLRASGGNVLLAAAAFPPFYSLMLHGQTSVIPLLCVTGAFVALRADRRAAAGFALGSLIFKPQFGIAIAAVMLARREWRVMGGALAAIACQWMGPTLLWGAEPMAQYVGALRRGPDVAGLLEPKLYQLHSLRGFSMLLLGPSAANWVLVAVLGAATLVIAVRLWQPRIPLETRFSALLLAMVLVAPHAGIYDLVLLAPAFLLTVALAAEAGDRARRTLRAIVYLAFVALLVAPLAAATRLQLSVPLLLAWLWELQRVSSGADQPAGSGPAGGKLGPMTQGSPRCR